MKHILSSFFVAAVAAGALFLNSCKQQSASPTQASAPLPMPESVTQSADPAIVFCYDTTVTVKKTSTTYHDLYVCNADGSNKAPVYSTSSSSLAPLYPRFSADGKTIAFGIGPIRSRIWKTIGISVVNGVPSGSNLTTLLDLTASQQTVVSLAYSPDSTKIAYCVTGDAGGTINPDTIHTYIYTIPVGGGTASRVYAAPQGTQLDQLAWSNDGKNIACTSMDYTNNRTASIQVVDIANGTLQMTLVSGQYGYPIGLDWSRSGSNIILFAGSTGSAHNLYTVAATAGSSASNVLSNATWGSWSPDNSKIVFTSHTSGVLSELTVSGGTSQNIISGLKNNPSYPSWRRF